MNLENNGRKAKTVVIGLDGASFELLGPWIESGHLPSLKGLMDKGCSGVLESTVPPLSPVAWTSFLTGVNPGKHGIYDFLEPLQHGILGIRMNNRLDCKEMHVWRHLNANGYRTTIVNVPMTYPPEPLDGIMISGMDTPNPDTEFTYPASLKKEIFEKLGDYIIEIKHSPKLLAKTSNYIEALKGMISSQLKATHYLIENHPWDFFMVVFTASDRAQHNLWKFMDPKHPEHDPREAEKFGDGILRVYKELDNAVGSIVSVLDKDTNIVVVSDHGADILYKTVALNNWLAEKGLLFFKNKASGIGSHINNKVNKIINIFNRIVFKKRDLNFNKFFDSIDWTKTKAFFIGASGKIFVTLKDKYPFGIVKKGKEYESIRDEIIKWLKELKDPNTGKPVVNRVYKKEEIYSGAQFASASDLVIAWERGYNSIIKSLDMTKGMRYDPAEGIFSINQRMSSDHSPDGIFIISTPHTKQNIRGLRASIMDICPTMLYMMDTPVPSYMDGKVLVELFDEELLKERPIKRSGEGVEEMAEAAESAYSQDEAKEIADRLRGLGYLE